jgi:ATP-dependent Clp protease ATP-binding subunit ClpA
MFDRLTNSTKELLQDMIAIAQRNNIPIISSPLFIKALLHKDNEFVKELLNKLKIKKEELEKTVDYYIDSYKNRF